MAITGYIRVSSNKQTLEHQEFEIKKFAKSQKIKIDRWVEEKISSRKPLAKRQLGQLLNELKEGDILIACEISRLGRSLLEVIPILESCLNKNCQVQHMLKNPFYYGVMRVKKKFYPHKYPPLITKDLWDRLQDVMNNRARASSHLNDIDELKAKLKSWKNHNQNIVLTIKD